MSVVQPVMVTPTREEILAVYAAGPEAVVLLVQQLCEAHAREIAALTARVEALEARLAQDSHNSHKPPSSDGLVKKRPKPKSLRQRSGKKPGGQRGRAGHTRRLVAQPDAVIEHGPAQCAQCGQELATAPATYVERRQVAELPPQRLVVTEHRVSHKVCPACAATTAGTFPVDVTQPVQYGPRLKATCVYLQDYQLLPFARTQELLHDLFGETVSLGTLANAQAAAAEQLAPIEAQIKATITAARVVRFDETGIRIAGRTQWLHVASTLQWTYYAYHAQRAGKAFDDIGILPVFRGTAVHDALATYLDKRYRKRSVCQHALCNAHLLRELIALEETTAEAWPQQLIDLLLHAKAEVAQAREASATALAPARQAALTRRYQRLVQRGLRLNPRTNPPGGRRGRTQQSPARNLLECLRDHRKAVLASMYHFEVPADNNLAERDVRMIKVRHKVSGCFRSSAAAFCRICGYISTLRKQGQGVIQGLLSLFGGPPFVLQLAA